MAEVPIQAEMSARFRAEMPVSERFAYFDHAAVAPLPQGARREMAAWLDQATEQGDLPWLEWNAQVRRLRESAARLIGARATEIALVPNTTLGLSLVAEGWPWQAGDNVVTLANEFPSNLYPWLNLASRGVETKPVPVDNGAVDLQRLEDACDDRTRLMSVSWVGYASGWRLNLVEVAALCRRKNVRLVVDAIQGLGVFPIDAKKLGIDFLAADGHKWLLGPEGAGLLYVREEHRDRLRTIGVGWNSVQAGHDFGRIELKLRDDSARWEGGALNMAGMIGLGASIDLLQRMGTGNEASAVAERAIAVADHLCERLSAIGATVLNARPAEHRSATVLFQPKSDVPHAEIRSRLAERGVVVSCRAGGIRATPHAYNNAEDVERLIAGLLECA